jgi:hypothetical protein
MKVLAVTDLFGYLNTERAERAFWIHQLNLVWEFDGWFITVHEEIRKYPNKFFEYHRMSISSYDELLEKLRSHIEKILPGSDVECA